MKNLLPLLGIFLVLSLNQSCSSSSDPDPVIPPSDTTSLPVSSPLTETFESGTKNDYASGSLLLNSGKWNFTDAVIGSTAEDKKVGSKSARIIQNGKISMNFDVINGIYAVVIAHAVYGTDQPSDWQLWVSYNSGGLYSQIGSTITTSSSTLKYDTLVINSPGKVRFSIRKTTGGGNRINIDDFKVILTAPPAAAGTADNDNMLMGNPSNATPSILSANNFFMNKGYYALCYNRDEGKSNWVSWHLYNNDIGSTARQNDFRLDPQLPSTWFRAENTSFTGSGFDRGHCCPSADRTSTVAANSSTFLMTNMIPQANGLNTGAWGNLEDSCRQLVFAGNELYIITGSFGTGGTGVNGFANSINDGNIVVPRYIWKVIVVLPNGNNDLSRINSATRVIAFLAPNDQAANTNWKTYRVSVDAIEAQTGYDLLSSLSASLQSVLEARVDAL